MPKCKTPTCECRVMLSSDSWTKHAGICSHCRSEGKKAAAKAAITEALDTCPTRRTRAQWEAIRDVNVEKIKCFLAQGLSVTGVAAAHNQAIEALAALPVTICPYELARLQRRDTVLAELEAEVAPCLNPTHNFSGAEDAGTRLLYWLKQTTVLMGKRF